MNRLQSTTQFFAALLSLTIAAAAAHGQTSLSTQASASGDLAGSITTARMTDEVLPLSLDEAIRRGLENNLALHLSEDDRAIAHAQTLDDLNELVPNVSLSAENGVHQYNLEAQGFTPGVVGYFGAIFGNPHAFDGLSLITRATVTTGQLNFRQELFNWSLIDQYRSSKAGETVAYYNMRSSRGLVVLAVGTAYLQALAAASEVDNARSLLRTDETLLNQAVEEHKAGTAANLDELRARVQYQTQQQTVISDENAFEKAKIALLREIGIPAGQKVQLTDAAPYAELEAMTIEDARQKAYASRQDYQSLQWQVRQAQLGRDAAKHERYPTVSFNSNYAVTGVSGSVYHGLFTAGGQLNVPIFQEAKFRGDRAVAEAQLSSALNNLADLRSKIDAQLRDSLLDVQTAAELVRVTRSNVDLSTVALQQTTDRFQAGVDDNLPVVQAQSTLADAQNRLVQSVQRYNQAKLGLARNLGIIDIQYKAYMQTGEPKPIDGSKGRNPQGGR